jgi:hypothetical protein
MSKQKRVLIQGIKKSFASAQSINFISDTEQARIIQIQKISQLKEELISEFESHNVTKELSKGAGDPVNTPNYSKTLSRFGKSYGNLFTFLGFKAGEDPTRAIRALIDDIGKNKGVDTLSTQSVTPISINFPTLEELYKVTPLDWYTGRSWVKGIETHVSGLPRYLHSLSRTFKNSRSGPAIQTKNNPFGVGTIGRDERGRFSGSGTLSGSFKRTEYMTEMFKRYERLFDQI